MHLILVILVLCKVYILGSILQIDDEYSYVNILISDGIIALFCVSANYFALFLGVLFGRLVRFIISAVVVFYFVDFTVLSMFHTRLYLEDVFKYLTYLDIKYFSWWGVFIALCMLIISVKYIFYTAVSSGNLMVKMLLPLCVAVVFMFYDVNSSVRSPFVQNYFLVNYNKTYDIKYSDAFLGLIKKPALGVCASSDAIRPDNIYIFIVESWSNYQSEYFGNDNNWTPNLDYLAESNISLKNFHANGFTTEAGVYAIFTGDKLIPYNFDYAVDGGVGLMDVPFNQSKIMPFNKLGFNTTFITSGNLGFLNKRSWLEKIGFDNIYGNEIFNLKDRKFLFQSVPDELLFKKVKQLISEQKKPHLVVVENVTTHQPFYYPDGDAIEKSEKKSFEYTDKHMTNLINSLRSDNNMIVVLSDHRAMTSLTDKEIKDSERMAVSKVPAFLIWKNYNVASHVLLQQTDLLPSITDAIQGVTCQGLSRGTLFPVNSMQGASCIYHARGDERSIVSVKCSETQFDVVLDGDNTRVADAAIQNKSVINDINYIRVGL